MKRSTIAIVLVLAVVSLMSVGCCKKQEDQIALLQRDNQQLLQNQGNVETIRAKLAQEQERNNELGLVLQSKETEIDGLKIRVANLQAEKLATPPAPPKGPVPAGWQETATGAKITLGSDILFSAGKATLTSKGAASLQSIAATIKSTYPSAMVRVYGFTDSDPIVKSAKLWRDNLDLSANRAMAVTRYLQKRGIAAANIETVAMGKERPVSANSTKSGKARNRRVEIVVVKP